MSQSQPYYVRDYRPPAGGRVRPRGSTGGTALGSGIAVWRALDKATYDRFVAASLDAGALTSINTSSDGGVLHAFILHGSKRYDAWFRNEQEADECYSTWADCLERMGYIPTQYGGQER